MHSVEIALEAVGQGLVIKRAPAVLASDVEGLLRFAVELSPEWEGFSEYAVMLQSGPDVYACELKDGTAVANAEPIADAGLVEVAVIAQGNGRRLTTARAIIRLQDSGL